MSEKKARELRYERKFLVHELSTHQVRHLLVMLPGIFRKLHLPRRINNIYLDSLDYRNYLDSIEGEKERMKVRIRWYGKTIGQIHPVLEIKMKHGEIGKKLSFPLHPFAVSKRLSREFLMQEVFMRSNLPDAILAELKQLTPVLLNSYLREYYQSANKACRVTLDSEQVFIKLHPAHNTFTQRIKDPRSTVIEIKYSQQDAELVHQMFKHLPFRLVQNSKYTYGLGQFIS
ncbi:polyphosphate polymerase domain-containing protein [Candidatus Pacearchaeota archaeon]|nr:polyphosphate polymerase domain-containing protein [Candidatus Pacearchaeota archaeon]